MKYNFRNQASTASQCKVSIFSYTLPQSWVLVAKKTPLATLVLLLGLGAGCWVNTEANAQSARFPNAPKIAQAENARVDLSIVRQPDETYETLLSRAEAAAQVAVQENFDRDINLADVSVMVVAQNQGAIAPVLSIDVSRTQWFSNPDIHRWIKYFATARLLLGFEGVATTAADQAGTSTPDPVEQSESGASDTEGINNMPPETETATPVNTPNQPTGNTFTQPGTDNGVTPRQNPASSTDFLNPQPPAATPLVPAGNIQSPTLPNTVSPGFPSGSTPASVPQTPSGGAPTSGTTTNNPLAPTMPNSNGSGATQLNTTQ